MPTLYTTKVIEGNLPELFQEAQHGDLIELGKKRRGVAEFWPHRLGVMQKVPDDKFAERCVINDKKEPVDPQPRGKCLPFGQGVIIQEDGFRRKSLRKGLRFLLAGKEFHRQPTKRGLVGVYPHPDGGLVIELESDEIILLEQDENGEKKVTVLNEESREYDWREFTPGGVVTRSKDGRFFFNSQEITDLPYRLGDNPLDNSHWKAFGSKLLIIEKRLEGWREAFVHDNPENRTLLEEGGEIVLLPQIGEEGSIVTRKGFKFSINKRPLPLEIPCDEAHFHPFGVLIERGEKFFLLVIK